jgi:hypothetical protein
MSDKVLAVFHAALKQEARRKLGDRLLDCQFIAVPHQRTPRLIDSELNPPEKGGDLEDTHVFGDHDFHRCIPLIDGLDYVGHQANKVVALADRELDSLLDTHWREEVLCDLYSGTSMHDPDFRRLASTLGWNCAWPEVDATRCLTGQLIDDADGYANVMDEAMMLESVALDAGLVIEDGYVHTKKEVK